MQIKTLLLAGGKGTRLWPLSRTYNPKPFVNIFSFRESLFQQTVRRSLLFSNEEDIYIVVNRNHAHLVRKQLREIGAEIPEENILLEPMPRDTLPAVLYGLWNAKKKDLFVLTPSDQYVKENHVLADAVKYAAKHADNYIVAMGVKPTEPYTGYGYIKPGKKIAEQLYEVDAFKEKPDRKKAEEYVKKGYLWNTFIHVFRAEVLLGEIKMHAPEIFLEFEKYDGDVAQIYPRLEPISLSKRVLEKTKKNTVIPLAITWSDMGTFDLVHKLAEKDEMGNAYTNQLIAVNASGNYIQTYGDKIVAIVGLNDIFVVDTPDALLIGKNSEAQKVKEVVKYLEAQNDIRKDYHRHITREWGEMEFIEADNAYRLAEIRILPGKRGKISVKRGKVTRFIILSGAAEVLINGTKKILTQGDQFSAENGTEIEIYNPGNEVLKIFEITFRKYYENPYIEILKELEG